MSELTGELCCVDLGRAGAPCVGSRVVQSGNDRAADRQRYTSVSLYACSRSLHDDTKGSAVGSVFAGSPGMLVVLTAVLYRQSSNF